MDSELLMLGAVVVGLAVIGLIPAAIAYSKGWNFLTWWAWGALMFPYALVAALTMQRNEETLEARALAAGMVKCPSCSEMIWNEAEVCQHCGRDLTTSSGKRKKRAVRRR